MIDVARSVNLQPAVSGTSSRHLFGRSRFDLLSQQLRQPEGEIYIGGDTTEDSHSEGAVRAGLRMFNQIIKNRVERNVQESSLSVPCRMKTKDIHPHQISPVAAKS